MMFFLYYNQMNSFLLFKKMIQEMTPCYVQHLPFLNSSDGAKKGIVVVTSGKHE